MFKKLTAALLASLLILVAATSCSKPITEDDERPLVYTSFFTIYDFAEKIGGDLINLKHMIPFEGSSHDWEPAAADMISLEQADVFIYNGAGLEFWVDDVLATIENKDLLVIDTSEKVELTEGHSHDHDHDHDQDHDQGDMDSHIWLSPLNAKIQMAAIRDAFIEIDPANQSTYEANYTTQAAALGELDSEFRNGLANLRSRDLVVSHEAFGYLATTYDLHQIAVEGLVPDSEPDAARLAEIIDFVNDEGIEVVFFEANDGSKVADVIAAETAARTAVLSPIESLTAEQVAAGADYFSIMRENLATIKAELG